MKSVLADTGVWYAMFDARDQHHPEIDERSEILERLRVVVPWPTIYETLRTKFVRNRIALSRFEKFLKGPRIVYVDDRRFREQAFELALYSSLRRGRPLSMVDCLIRLLLDDVGTRVDYLATFNSADFVDVCVKNRVEII